MNLSEIAREVFQTQLQTMKLNLDGCVEGKDPIHLHDLRVANRQTRAALIEFTKLLPDDTRQRYAKDFHWIHLITGEVRDLDVVLSHYSALKKELPKAWRSHLKPLRLLVEKKRNTAQGELSEILQSGRVNLILQSWSDLLQGGTIDESLLSLEDAREYGSLRIIKRYRQLQKDGRNLKKSTSAKKYHEYRILVKKLRYMMEFFRPAMDQEDFEKLHSNLKTVQGTFGVFRDTEIQILNLKKLSKELFENGGSVETILALGLLLGVLEKRYSRTKKKCLKQAQRLISEASARSFQRCFQYPVE